MKIKFGGKEVDDNLTVKELVRQLGVDVISINKKPSAQDILDSC